MNTTQERKCVFNSIVHSYSFDNGKLSVKMYLNKDHHMQFHVFSLNGRLLHVENAGVMEGGNNSVSFNINFLPVDAYVVCCVADGKDIDKRKIILFK